MIPIFIFIFCYSQQIRWTKEQDLMLVKEILLFEPFTFKKGSQERGQRCWEQISESLNLMGTFQTSKRSVRDRFNPD